MFKRNIIYTAIIVLLLPTWGCDKLIFDQHPDDGGSGGKAPKVYLTVSHGGAAKLRSSVDQPDDPTINTDVQDYEDWVHDLALFVFDTGSGALVTSYYDGGNSVNEIKNSFVIELTPGQRDFYFVANMPASSLSNITDRASMNTYMSAINTLDGDLYQAAIKSKGFPMARVYSNQTVNDGGTVYQPTPFKPTVDNVPQNEVLLIRVVAKLEVKISELERPTVEKITLKNAFTKYHLNYNNSLLSTANDIYKEVELKYNSGTASYIAYMPEALMNNATWGTGNHEPINYFVIENTAGNTFDIPIITAENNYTFDDKYLAFAKNDNNTEKYNIYRNRKYYYEVRNLSNIEIKYEIKPWELVHKSLYMGYGYNVEIDENGKVTITNTIDDCMPHKVELKALNGAYFGADNTKTEVVYGYSSTEETGFIEAKMKTGYSESFKINNDAVTTGNYLEVWYNGTKVKTFSK